MTDNPVEKVQNLPKAGVVHESSRGNWQAQIYEGTCDHQAADKWGKDHKMNYGTAYCPDCEASRGLDDKWRVLVDV